MILLLASVFMSGFSQVRANGPDDQFNAAATDIGHDGTFGAFQITEPGVCEFAPLGNRLYIGYDGDLKVNAVFPHFTQKVGVIRKLYQKLANGSLGYLSSLSETTAIVGQSFTNVPYGLPIATTVYGPDYVAVFELRWYASDNTTVEGWRRIAISTYEQVGFPGDLTTPVCPSPFVTDLIIDPVTSTVNTTLHYKLDNYPRGVTVLGRWDGTVVESVVTDGTGEAEDSFKVPAAPKGPHTVKFSYGHWETTATFIIKPRIKIIPSEVSRGDTVNVSLRGFAKNEVVQIRWKKGAGWKYFASVTTSNTGSANVNVVVPSYVPDGLTSVRGDGATSAAQTNAVTVDGGPFVPATLKTPTPTATPSLTATPTMAAPQPSATATSTPAVQPTVEATATATAPVETPTPEPTQPPNASPVAEMP
jgi:cell division septation protein DedD